MQSIQYEYSSQLVETPLDYKINQHTQTDLVENALNKHNLTIQKIDDIPRFTTNKTIIDYVVDYAKEKRLYKSYIKEINHV